MGRYLPRSRYGRPFFVHKHKVDQRDFVTADWPWMKKHESVSQACASEDARTTLKHHANWRRKCFLSTITALILLSQRASEGWKMTVLCRSRRKWISQKVMVCWPFITLNRSKKAAISLRENPRKRHIWCCAISETVATWRQRGISGGQNN